MLDNQYPIDIYPSFQSFEFVSVGTKGAVTKLVRYTQTAVDNVYNLGFGDKNNLTGDIDDLIVTNNGDMQKVLATVAATLYTFSHHFPTASIFADGSTAARTRLYQIGISNNLEAIIKDFVVLGLIEDNWSLFRKNISYEAFLVTPNFKNEI